jgi:hypothetical protein
VEAGPKMMEFLEGAEEIHLGIDEHSFSHHDMVIIVTELRKRRVVGVLEDDRLATLEDFLKKIPANRVKEVCIDMKTGYRKVVQRLFPDYVNKTMLGFPPYESFHTIFKIEPAKSFQKYPVILSLFKSRVFPSPFSRFSSFCHARLRL